MIKKCIKEKITPIIELITSYEYMQKDLEALRSLDKRIIEIIKLLKYEIAVTAIDRKEYERELVDISECKTRIIDRIKLLSKSSTQYSLEEKNKIYINIVKYINNNEVLKIESLLNQKHFDVNYVPIGSLANDSDELIPLLVVAAKRPNLSIIKILVNSGAKINIKHTYFPVKVHNKLTLKNYRSPLLTALYYGNYAIASYLLQKGANGQDSDFEGNSALHIISRKIPKRTGILSEETELMNITEKLLANGLDINAKNNKGEYALFNIINNFSYYFLQLLVKNGAQTDIIDENKNTLLHHLLMNLTNPSYLERSNNFEKFNLLLKNKIDINAQNFENRTVLHYAAKYLNFGYLTSLVEKQIDVNLLDKNQDNALHLLLKMIHHYQRSNDWIITKAIKSLIKANIKLEVKNNEGRTPLALATKCVGFDLTYIKLLLENGAIDHNIDKYGNTLLHLFLKYCDYGKASTDKKVLINENREIMKKLAKTEHQDNVNIKNNQDEMPLHYAIVLTSNKYMKDLLKYNAKINVVDNDGQTPLHWLFYSCSREQKLNFVNDSKKISYLINNGFDINSKDKYGNSFSHYVSTIKDENYLKFLLEKGLKVNKVNKKGETELHFLMNKCFLEEKSNQNLEFEKRKAIIKILIKNGVSVWTKNEKNETVIDLASKLNDKQFVTYLINN